ncbi:MAG: T9SS type A sorting domain-containing protein [Flavobacteriales bacterium]|nr:T9SS type A sorting domain-containing protein [Flavobacteriales bacterium]
MRFWSTALFCLPVTVIAQDLGTRNVVLQEITLPGMPGLQSFAWGQHQGQWFLVGGRTDGLHRRQPPFAFLAADNNTNVYVVDPATQQVWSASLNTLPTNLKEQLQSTNMEFEQRDSTLYCAGGYGYSSTAADHITYPYLTAIDLPGAMDAIRTGQSIVPYFRQLNDARMEVTGGQMRLLHDRFHLVGGQRFIGRYNPMGPDFGPGFIQEYTNAIRRFDINDNGVDLVIADYAEEVDTVNLHRRDYNMLPQIKPDGSEGLTVFSGVFQYGQDLPWLNTVDISDSGYTVVPAFEQLLNQYHTAHAALYDSTANIMHSLFFGGIGRYYFNGGTLMDDQNVPFVNTISLVSRDGNGSLEEAAIGEMPALLGASGEFIPLPGTPQHTKDIIRLDELAGDTVLIGHVVGGIESSAQNIFFVNTGVQSDATMRIFQVHLVNPGAVSVPEQPRESNGLSIINSGSDLQVSITLETASSVQLTISDSSGRIVRTLVNGPLVSGQHTFHSDISELASGSYLIHLSGAGSQKTERFVH